MPSHFVRHHKVGENRLAARSRAVDSTDSVPGFEPVHGFRSDLEERVNVDGGCVDIDVSRVI